MAIRHPVALCVATVLVLLAVRLASVALSSVAVPSGTATAGGGRATYEASVDELNAHVAAAHARLAQYPGSWVELERAANAHLARARFCDKWNDYAAADALMARAFAIAPAGTGPFLGRARLNFTVHRFDRVERDLARAESQLLLSPRVQSEIGALRADVALEQGRSGPALDAYRRAVDAQRNFSTLARLAGGLAKTGALSDADDVFARAADALPRSATKERAWVSLQRGLLSLEAQRLDDALAHYRAAEALLPGWWLADEHIAEALALKGKDRQAMAIYERVLASTGDPEFMDAMARIHRNRGELVTAAAWIARAKQGHAQRMTMFPEAAAGHAQQHIRDFGAI